MNINKQETCAFYGTLTAVALLTLTWAILALPQVFTDTTHGNTTAISAHAQRISTEFVNPLAPKGTTQ